MFQVPSSVGGILLRQLATWMGNLEMSVALFFGRKSLATLRTLEWLFMDHMHVSISRDLLREPSIAYFALVVPLTPMSFSNVLFECTLALEFLGALAMVTTKFSRSVFVSFLTRTN